MATSFRTSRIKKIRVTIPALDSLDIETVSFDSFSSTKYFIEYMSTAQGVYLTFELVASKKNSGVSDSIHSKLGDAIDVQTQVLKSGTDVILRAVNAEAFDLDARVSKITS